MAKIIKLDKNLANQIAAGEVVERPASVIKELVENSIDAGATQIKVEIFEGGTKKIIVGDNGFGIEKEDLALLGEKHSTSKIKNLEDLYNVMTFGFRGEAISSISSVSNMEIFSKSVNEVFGNSLKIISGDKQKITQISQNDGTKIIVENLFYNTPARLNYLKTTRTEQNHIQNYLYEVSLAYPNVGFEFSADGKNIFKFKEKEDLKTRIYNIYGKDLAENLLNVKFEMIGVEISGYISDPKISFQNRQRQNLFVNKRPIKSHIIAKAINDAYNRFIPHGMNPAYVLNIEVDPTSVDVNVHPRKQEVRFENEQNIFRAVYHAVEEKLNNVSLLNIQKSDESNHHKLLNSQLNILEKKESYYTGSGTKFKSYSPYKNININPSQGKIGQAIEFSKEILDPNVKIVGRFCEDEEMGRLCEDFDSNDLHFTKLGKIIGQAHNSYIIVETSTGIKFFDQHALAERIIYEKLDKIDKKFSSQQLLISESVNLTPKEANFILDNLDTFSQMGFDLELMPGNIVIINSIPDFIKKENLKEIISGVLEDIGISGLQKSKTLDEVKNKIYAYTACRSAIKFGNKLNLFEMNKLLNDSVENYSSTCPHGRPVIFEINLEELKGKYER